MILNKHKLYILSTYFPPTISVASNRILAFANYIDKSVFDVEVITVENENNAKESIELVSYKVKRFKNSGLFHIMKFTGKESFFIHKLKAAYNKVFTYFVRNEYQLWQNLAEKYLSEKFLQNKKSIVLSTYAPVSTHLAALNLKKKGNDFFWIADFRDNMIHPHFNKSQENYFDKIQKEIVSSAELILSVSEPILDYLAKYQTTKKSNFLEIRNGFDFDMENVKKNFNNIFTVSYVGSFYGERKPFNFFEALKLFLINNSEAKIQINFVGVGNQIQIPDFASKIISTSPKVTHNQALQAMQDSDALLLIHPNQNQKGVFSGKIFEYLGCLKPIIATVDKNDVAAKLIEDCRAGFVAEFDDINATADCFQKAYDLWLNHKSLDFNLDLIKQHHRKVQVKRLNEELKNLLKL